jgi:hypothetical protein
MSGLFQAGAGGRAIYKLEAVGQNERARQQEGHVLGGELEMDWGSCVLWLWKLRSRVSYRDRIAWT